MTKPSFPALKAAMTAHFGHPPLGEGSISSVVRAIGVDFGIDDSMSETPKCEGVIRAVWSNICQNMARLAPGIPADAWVWTMFENDNGYNVIEVITEPDPEKVCVALGKLPHKAAA